MYHTKFSATIHPAHLSATFEGEGESPEQARRSCEMQLSSYMARIRRDFSREDAPVLKAFTCIDTDYENTPIYPRIAIRKEDQAKGLGKTPRGFFGTIASLFDSLGAGVR